ncbi:Uncharacterised protein [Streptococcus pneumoniae]|nr:Uncharacterised protein [Streptococcus pneumoniae]
MTLRIITSLHQLGYRNLFRILFRLREIDGNFKFSIIRWNTISDIFSNGLEFDVVIFLTELIKILYRLLRRVDIGFPEVTIDLTRIRSHQVHQFSTKDFTRSLTILNHL